MKRKDGDIHSLILEKFGTNKLHDERFSGEGYWEWAEKQPSEPSGAAPDQLAGQVTPWVETPSDAVLAKADLIRRGFFLLTRQERRIVLLCAGGLSLENASTRLGLSKTGGYAALKRARIKLKKFYSTRKPN